MYNICNISPSGGKINLLTITGVELARYSWQETQDMTQAVSNGLTWRQWVGVVPPDITPPWGDNITFFKVRGPGTRQKAIMKRKSSSGMWLCWCICNFHKNFHCANFNLRYLKTMFFSTWIANAFLFIVRFSKFKKHWNPG